MESKKMGSKKIERQSSHGPVVLTLDEDHWFLVARGRWGNGEIDAQDNYRHRAEVYEHRDGRHAVFVASIAGPNGVPADFVARYEGEVVSSDEDPIHVLRTLAAKIDLHEGALRACIADMPPLELV